MRPKGRCKASVGHGDDVAGGIKTQELREDRVQIVVKVKLGCDKPRQVRVVSVEKEGLGNTQAQVVWCNACSAAFVGCAQLGGWTVFGG